MRIAMNGAFQGISRFVI